MLKLISINVFFPRDSKISSGEKMKIGGGDDIAWLQITEPTEKDKGNYTFEIFGAKESYKRTLDLSGQGMFVRSDFYCAFSQIMQILLEIEELQ